MLLGVHKASQVRQDSDTENVFYNKTCERISPFAHAAPRGLCLVLTKVIK